MADDRMKNDDLQRNMGGAEGHGKEGTGQGQQSPGRTGQMGQQGGQQTGGKQEYGGGQQQGGTIGQQGNMEDDEEFGAGGAGQAGGQTRGQNR